MPNRGQTANAPGPLLHKLPIYTKTMNANTNPSTDTRIFGAFTLARPLLPHETVPPDIDPDAVKVTLDVIQHCDEEEVRLTVVASGQCAQGWTPRGQGIRFNRRPPHPGITIDQQRGSN